MKFTILTSFIKILAVLGIVVLQVSCQKEALEVSPLTSISGDDAYSTPAKITAQVNALYGQLSDASYFGGRNIIFNEQRGNEFSQNDGNNSTGANVWNQTISASGDFVNAVWNAGYRSINSANILIDRLNTSTVVSDAVKKNYIAEAKFIRAFSYFALVQTYARPFNQNSSSLALPLRLTGETAGGNNDFVFSTVAQVYTQILKDLNEAEADLPGSYGTALLNVSRAHKATAIALKTRVYLVKSDFDQVIVEAAKLVPALAPYQYSSGTVTHSLEPDLTKLFNGTYTGSEAIFTIPFVIAAEAPGQQSALAYNYLSPVLYLNTSGGIIADPVFSTTSVDQRKALVQTNAVGQQLLRKFSKNSAPHLDYVPLIRYAEVLLNYAEAAAQKDQPAKALTLLSAVRNRSNPTFIYTTGVTLKDELLQTIYNERRIELLGEGFRTPDLFRRNLALPAKSGNAGTAPQILPTAANYVWPVPSGELAYNKLAPR
ncbi:RagB/SusD family nutrient uptake outer membrane protein [Pedobacter sp. MC2016-14]|uniref:RagB/SusD family nutrient uptake outer membrane protein n=1 Tax=Pedobacter sp. MC2016-14 TaxID=2897327 RepID=UPI001E36F00A|nr:RagB/SusD family nutrient uptake outer membrane protein [Pedobacter sp. MC2016-14]MCD0489123.1 RagB/SusD family nutrient uptake outer membrane protein [Pedobacter sp. MC2016-14]